ncbi:MAG: hypothetical protein F6K54_38750 [Okeania sp. SIO3B5]|uniref:hypothetical protein n=1 Tax=Okeania sp. SIO3B5 TaxID=2607811 RepID=UPI001401726C|nr:hypothetical protein [Okeania sp. SIO3B5]NEO58475.1 hypothetical protein [Okeania sp. SIO3B5]
MNIKDFKSVLIFSVAIVLGVFVAPAKAANISRVVDFEDLTLGAVIVSQKPCQTFL